MAGGGGGGNPRVPPPVNQGEGLGFGGIVREVFTQVFRAGREGEREGGRKGKREGGKDRGREEGKREGGERGRERKLDNLGFLEGKERGKRGRRASPLPGSCVHLFYSWLLTQCCPKHFPPATSVAT